MKKLNELSTEEIKAELAKREQAEKERKKPVPLNKPDYSKLERMCIGYIDLIHSGEYVDEDIRHYIFEESINAIFGKGVWAWIREQGY